MQVKPTSIADVAPCPEHRDVTQMRQHRGLSIQVHSTQSDWGPSLIDHYVQERGDGMSAYASISEDHRTKVDAIANGFAAAVEFINVPESGQ